MFHSGRTYLLCSLLAAGLQATGAQAYDVGSRILATGGATQVEGSAGGGLVPWAVIGSYGQAEEWGATVSTSVVDTGDYQFQSTGVTVGIGNRLEVSLAHQNLDISTLSNALSLPDSELTQNTVGFKLRLFGDLLYDQLPQVSLGVQHKRNTDFDIPGLVGAVDDSGTDIYLSASRLWLDGIGGYPVLLSLTARHTKANQLGLLGFGGDQEGDAQWVGEASVGVMLRRDLMLGYEYRQKPDNLGFAQEHDWQDVFVAWFPSKNISLVAAWADLGDIATLEDQRGAYFSLQASF